MEHKGMRKCQSYRLDKLCGQVATMMPKMRVELVNPAYRSR